jgi:hypothetical protein
MSRLSAPPGEVGDRFADDRRLSDVVVDAGKVWDGYLQTPAEDRIGICSSGGGIRSAAFSLGALQILREEGLLDSAEHLSCVSGGGYITIAHAVLASETIKRASADSVSAESAFFLRLSPWAQGSPEENHLRTHVAYLGAGLVGRLWMVANLIYGIVRHLLPFVAALYLIAASVGLAMSGWLGGTLRTQRGTPCTAPRCAQPDDLVSFLWLSVGLIVVAGIVMGIRNAGQTGGLKERSLFVLQYLSIGILACGLGVLGGFVVLPRVLMLLHDGALDSVSRLFALNLTALAGAVGGVASWIAKNRRTKWFHVLVVVATTLAAPIVILVPFVGIVYWNAQSALTWSAQPARFVLLGASFVYVLLLWLLLDEVTSVAHLFYRERLATAFVGYRRFVGGGGPRLMRYAQPSWDEPLWISKLQSGRTDAKLPNLVVCAAVNLSGDLPVGRMGASFTFERDLVGGPETGYMPTVWMECRARGSVTMPALMAISGAAVSPSMGKMTLPAFRFLMALFDLRLGAWLPNPFSSPMRASTSEIRTTTPKTKDTERHEPRYGAGYVRPGALYVFREAFGLNSIQRPYVYVTDGGHWENLGLVELLRRGCARIVCIDGSGGDAVSFGTLSEAIALARSDLGVEISINLSQMRAAKGEESEMGFAYGNIRFPDGTHGTLVYIRALRTKTMPEDLRSYAMKDPKFPNHPTSDQFFNEERLEAYRALGQHLTRRALEYDRGDVEVFEGEVTEVG